MLSCANVNTPIYSLSLTRGHVLSQLRLPLDRVKIELANKSYVNNYSLFLIIKRSLKLKGHRGGKGRVVRTPRDTPPGDAYDHLNDMQEVT